MSVGFLTRKGLPFSNVVNDGVATCSITTGRTIETLGFKLGGTAFTKAMIKLIKVKANGKVIVEITGPQLDKLNSYQGQTADAGFIDIHFFDPFMLSNLDRMVSAFDTSGVVSLTIEVTIAGATAPTLDLILVESALQKDNSGNAAPYANFISKIASFPFSVAAGGKLVFPHVPYGAANGCIIKRLHVFHGGNMTGVTVKQDGLVVHESVTAENQFAQKRDGKVPQVGVYTIDFCPDGVIANALNTRDARSLEWLFDFSAADNGTVLVEMVDTLGNN